MTEERIEAPPDVPVAVALERLGKEGRPGLCDTGRYLCRYALWGDGPPIVFVHGLSDVARSFALVAAELSRDFTCILYELPTGEADRARLGGYRHRHFAADLIALLDHLHLDRTYAVGASFGSTVVLRTMAEQPARFARAVLQGGFARRRLPAKEVVLCQFARYAPGLMSQLPFKTSLKSEQERLPFRQAPPDRWQFLRGNCDGSRIATVGRWGLLISQLDLRPLLPRVRVPVRLIGGDADGIVPMECEAELLRGLPSVERIEIPGCGHMPQYTHSGLFAELVRRFFTPTCGREPGPDCDHRHDS